MAYPKRVSFFVRYRANGRRRTVKIGDYPATMPEDARKAALSILGAASKGEDEAQKRKDARETATASTKRITFAAWRETYFAEATRRLKSPVQVARYLRMAGAAWDARPVEEITTRDVEAFRNRLAETGGATQANRWLATIAASFMAALRLGHIEKNPAALVRHLPENAPRQRVLSADEEKRFRAAVASEADPFVRVAFTLLLDTGARLSEVLHARRGDLTLDKTHAGTWRIPSPKAGRPQVVPILEGVGKIVDATPEIEGCPFLVPGKNGIAHRVDLKKPWARLKAAANIGADVHVHDLRRSFGLRVTLAQGIFAASKLLRHSTSRITEAVYAPLRVEDLRAFAERTEAKRTGKTPKN